MRVTIAKVFEHFRRLLILPVVILVLLTSILVNAQARAILTLPDVTIRTGETRSVEARLDCGMARCSLFSIVLNFSPDIIRIDRLEIGTYLGAVAQQQVFIAENTVDNVHGSIELAAVSMGIPAAETDDLLFRIEVTALTPGDTQFAATQLEFGDLNGTSLSSEVIGGSVSVQRTATPFPETTSTAEVIAATVVTTAELCMVYATESGVPIRVGPGNDRAVRAALPNSTRVSVTGYATAEDGTKWWRIELPDVVIESDRYWVNETDVTSFGDCLSVHQVPASVVIHAAQPTSATALADGICNPGQWNAECGSNGCPNDNVSQCSSDGTTWSCVWNPGQCNPSRGSYVACAGNWDAWYAAWLSNYQQPVTPANSYVDMNGDGAIDGIDYVMCLNQQ